MEVAEGSEVARQRAADGAPAREEPDPRVGRSTGDQSRREAARCLAAEQTVTNNVLEAPVQFPGLHSSGCFQVQN